MTKTESADSAILAEQVRQWTQERDRLQGLIDVASGTESRLAATTQASTAQAEPTELQTVIAFLLGEGTLDGMHFGDSDTARPRARYWWREHLRAAAKGSAGDTGSGDE